MNYAKDFKLSPSWRPILRELGLNPADLLRRAGLPEDLMARPEGRVDTPSYFALWRATEQLFADPALPIHVAERLTAEGFEPAVFATLCSPNLAVALGRLARYKPLVAPVKLLVDHDAEGLRVAFEWQHGGEAPPASLTTMELAFVLRLARMGTREAVRPTQVCLPHRPASVEAHERYFGVRLEQAEQAMIRFSLVDAERPFLTANDEMWAVFEPALRRRLAEIDAAASTAQRVRAALLESLPSGRSGMGEVAERLGISGRTLQRRLQREGTSFRALLNETREQLARHYLERTELPCSEISFLLGFDEPNSFFRAFHEWTGHSPEQMRRALH